MQLHKLFSLFILLTCATFLQTTSVSAEEDASYYVELRADLYSKYMWRGLNLYDHFSVQPMIEAGYDSDLGGIGGYVWTYLPVGGGETEERYREVDYGLWYTLPTESIGITLGHLWYDYPRDSDEIPSYGEAFLSITPEWTIPVLELSSEMNLYYDYDFARAMYYELILSRDLALDDSEELFLSPYIELGATSSQRDFYSKNGFVQATVGLSISKSFGNFSLTPNIHYTYGHDDFLDNELWGGLTLSVVYP